MSRHASLRLVGAMFVLAAVAGPGGLATPVAASAAEDELRLETTSTYTLDPEAGVVHVAIEIRATNLKPDRETDTTITRYAYRELYFAIHREATAISATDGGLPLEVRLRVRPTFTQARVQLANQLDYRESARLELRYDLPGGAPRSESDIRVGVAFATFYAWAHGDNGLSDVRIVLPAGFEDEIRGGMTRRIVRGGRIIHDARAIADVSSWYVVVVAGRERALTADRLPIADPQVIVHAWPEDERWRSRVRDVLTRGLPPLQAFVGLAWPVPETLDVVEVHTPLLEGYAGVFLTSRARIEISEDLDDLTILHEASHAWFDESLFSERWIYEGLADEYASRALRAVGEFESPPGGLGPTDRAAVALNDWSHPGRITDQATDARETYGYNASWTVMRRLIDDVGVARMREVLAAAERNEIAYRAEGPPEPVAVRDDWRRFLDLLEEVGGADEAESVFARWVIGRGDADLLADRSDARDRYAELVDAADGWSMPYYIRYRMERWQFDLARERIAEAGGILDTRDAAARLAASLGLGVPPGLEDAFEQAETDLADADTLADTQLGALRAIDRARDALARPRDLVAGLGLAGGPTPEQPLATARLAFEAGDYATGVASSDHAVGVLSSAYEVGRVRLAALAGGGAGTVALLGLYGGVLIRRRRAVRAAPSTAPATSTTPYATAAGEQPAGTRGMTIDPSPPASPDPQDAETQS